MKDDQTIAVYDKNIEAYAKMVEYGKPGKALQSFINRIPKGGNVLDLGCGPGNSAAMLRDAGFSVDATDASSEMVSLANQNYSLNARQATFDDLSEVDAYDGIWANFSLLHASRDMFPTYIAAIYKALKANGTFHIGMKTGEDSKRDQMGRFYTYYSISELEDYLMQAGFEIHSTSTGEDLGLAGDVEPWVIILAEAKK